MPARSCRTSATRNAVGGRRARIQLRQLAAITLLACTVTPAFYFGLELVVSGSLLQRLELPPGIHARLCGELELRGKEARVAA